MPDAFRFLRPLWLLAFVPLALLVWYWIKRTQTESSWQRSIDDNLLGVLLDDTARSGQRWLRASMLVALTITLLGLAGPAWEKLPQNVEQKNDALVILKQRATARKIRTHFANVGWVHPRMSQLISVRVQKERRIELGHVFLLV